MDAPESTFVNHCGRSVMLLDRHLCLCLFFFFFVVCLISRNKCLRSWGASCSEIASQLIFCRVFLRDKTANSLLIYLYFFGVS